MEMFPFRNTTNVDMRKSIDELAYIVEQKFKLPAQSDMMIGELLYNYCKQFTDYTDKKS